MNLLRLRTVPRIALSTVEAALFSLHLCGYRLFSPFAFTKKTGLRSLNLKIRQKEGLFDYYICYLLLGVQINFLLLPPPKTVSN